MSKQHHIFLFTPTMAADSTFRNVTMPGAAKLIQDYLDEKYGAGMYEVTGDPRDSQAVKVMCDDYDAMTKALCEMAVGDDWPIETCTANSFLDDAIGNGYEPEYKDCAPMRDDKFQAAWEKAWADDVAARERDYQDHANQLAHARIGGRK